MDLFMENLTEEIIGLLNIIAFSAQRWRQRRRPAGPSNPVKEAAWVSESVQGVTVNISGVIPALSTVEQASYQMVILAKQPARAFWV